MLLVDRIQQLIVVGLVACSGWLLGIGQQNPGVSILSVTAAILSFVFNDWLQWVRLNRWVANIVALGVTAIALRGFFHSESSDQLFMIANLLIYLQIVLLFQIKTPRVYWQILVLSLLQIVVAAAFHISLEGGIVFFGYLLISGVAMVILQVHSSTYRIRSANRRTVNAIGSGQLRPDLSNRPIIVTMHDQIYPNRRPLRAMIRQVLALGVVSIAFAAVTFYLVPRDEVIWTGTQVVSDPQPGYSRTMDLEENVQIYLSNEVVLIASYFDPKVRRTIELPELPYFRGMPLTELTIRNNQTRWRAAQDPGNIGSRAILPGIWTQDFVVQTIELQPTNDPLLHTAYPAMRVQMTPADIEWSVPLALLARVPGFFSDGTRSFTYELAIPVLADLLPFEAFPLYTISGKLAQRIGNSADELSRAVYMDKARYPELVRIAAEQAAAVSNSGDSVEVARALTRFFTAPGQFEYTLDFRDFDWDESLDHIEDFVVNKRRGHCEFFASALVLMLRSQGIPARVVVGFHGGDFDQDTNAYVVRRRHAHAWVEAFIPPEDCPRSWFRTGQASANGAWLRLDPTPPSANENGRNTTALVAAKDFWNMYVMGLNSAKQRDSSFQSFVRNPFRMMASLVSPRYWRHQWQVFTTPGEWYTSAVFYAILILVGVLSLNLLGKWMRRNRRSAAAVRPLGRGTSFKAIIGRAISLVAPRLGRWVAGTDKAGTEVAFYQRFQRIMLRSGQRRQFFQTAREFARSSEPLFARDPHAAAIRRSIEFVVDTFYRVRFSQRPLTDDEARHVESSLAFLEQHLTPHPTAS